MSDAKRLVQEAARNARSNNDLVNDDMGDLVWEGDTLIPAPLDSPLDEETLDEQSSTQMGERYDARRRDAT